MRSRFLTNLLVLMAATVLLCCSLTLSPQVSGWVGMGTGTLILLITGAGFATRGRGTAQRVLDGAVTLLAAWTVVASRVFGPGPTLGWLMFSAAATGVALACAGLLAHEIVMELSLRRAARREELIEEIAADPMPPIRVAG